MQDHPPQNRAERRAQARKGKQPGAALVRPFRPPQNKAPEAAIGIGDPSASDDEAAQQSGPASVDFPFLAGADKPPADRKVSHKAGGSKQQRIWETLVSYYALAGLGVSRLDRQDGMLIVANAEKCADAWIAAGKSNPSIMRALELVTIAGPYTALITVHVTLAFSIMDRHGANPFAGLFARQPATGPTPATGEEQATPAPLPYVPLGANAPTEAAPPPTYQGDEQGFLVIPDEGIPGDLDIMLREAARTTGRPYEELRQEALVELAQMRMAQNGQNGHTPGALGAPVARG